ncbi:MAG: hypothetical protein AB7G28_20650 [Pirellulales bacterium]
MAGIMVYIPGGGSRKDFERLGLESLIERGMQAIAFDIAKGPDGGSGSLIGFDSPEHPRDTPTNYDESTQEWRPAAASGSLINSRYWVGYVRNQKPRPEELQRSQLQDGIPVELDDGGLWVIPIADYLPQRLSRDVATGEEISIPKVEHQEFVELANFAFEHFMSDGFAVMLQKRRVTIPNGRRLADLALEKNYRVNGDVADLLQLLDNPSLLEIALVATGLSTAGRIIAQKKSAEEKPYHLASPN